MLSGRHWLRWELVTLQIGALAILFYVCLVNGVEGNAIVRRRHTFLVFSLEIEEFNEYE